MLKGQVAIVTGGSRGIGRAICLELARLGVNVVVNYAGNVEKANEVVSECEKFGVKAIAVGADVSKMTEVEALVATTVETFGKIDILVNNAGITCDKLLMRMTESDFDRVIDTNLKGAFLTMKLVSKIMMKQRSGNIVNISSVVGLMGNAGQMNYAASKAGVLGMTKSLAREIASRGVRVNAVAPGFIETDMTAELSAEIRENLTKNIPLGTLGSPEDVAKVVAFLVGDGGAYLTGQVISVDGGMYM